MNTALKMQPQDQEAEAWDGLEAIISNNYTRYRKLIISITNNFADVDDVLQNVRLRMLKVINENGSCEHIEYLETFLYRTVINSAINLSRKNPLLLFDENVPERIESSAMRQDESLDLRNVCTKICRLLNGDGQDLDTNARETLSLFAHGLSYKEITKALNMKIGTVMSSINRGRKKLRDALGPEMCDVY